MREAGSVLRDRSRGGFDYERLMDENRDEVESLLRESKRNYVRANPAYEEMEGIVAGVPRLAQYDVDIDAGADGSDPENAVAFSLECLQGGTLEQPGDLFFVTETSLYGTNREVLAARREQRSRRRWRGGVRGGDPDAGIYVAAVREFERQAQSLDADAGEFVPTPSDAFTALTVMVPTMSEYFEAWKTHASSPGGRHGAGVRRHVPRLSDIADIEGRCSSTPRSSH